MFKKIKYILKITITTIAAVILLWASVNAKKIWHAFFDPGEPVVVTPYHSKEYREKHSITLPITSKNSNND